MRLISISLRRLGQKIRKRFVIRKNVSQACPGIRTRVGTLRNRDERCISPRAYRTVIRVSLEAESKKKTVDMLH